MMEQWKNETWKKGTMEEWNDGQEPIFYFSQYSSIPSFQYSPWFFL